MSDNFIYQLLRYLVHLTLLARVTLLHVDSSEIAVFHFWPYFRHSIAFLKTSLLPSPRKSRTAKWISSNRAPELLLVENGAE